MQSFTPINHGRPPPYTHHRNVTQTGLEPTAPSSRNFTQLHAFIQLSTVLSADGSWELELQRRYGKARRSQFHHADCKIKEFINDKIKTDFFRTTVIPILLYNAAIWTLTESQIDQLEGHYHELARHFFGVRAFQLEDESWVHPTRLDVLAAGRIPDVRSLLRQARLSFYGKLRRMDAREDDYVRMLWQTTRLHRTLGARVSDWNKATQAAMLETVEPTQHRFHLHLPNEWKRICSP